MSTELTTPPKTLQERVGDRIREQIGDLLTDDDLKRLVETALHDAFFKEVVVKDTWGSVREVKPPPITAIVRNLLKERVDQAATEWLAAHKDEFAKHIDDAIGRGIASFFVSWLDSRTFTATKNMSDNIKQQLGLTR